MATTTRESVLIGGNWRAAQASSSFRAVNPKTGEKLGSLFPISGWADCDDALQHAAGIGSLRPQSDRNIAKFLRDYASLIEEEAELVVDLANQETALPKAPRLAEIELPRTVDQLRQAAEAASNGSWAMAQIDTKANIRSCLEPLGGPVVVFGPNNFPLAFNSIAGGDFAAAIAAGNPVIAIGNPQYPNVTYLLARLAHEAEQSTGLPAGFVQFIHQIRPLKGLQLIKDPRVGAGAFTGSRESGLSLKKHADEVGTLFYMEAGSTNPVVILHGAIAERGDTLVQELVTSCLMGTGQFCTKPGLVILGNQGIFQRFVEHVVMGFQKAANGTLLSASVLHRLQDGIARLRDEGASCLAGSDVTAAGSGFSHANTVLSVTGSQFLEKPEVFQTELFGNVVLFVMAEDVRAVVAALEGNLTGCIYSARVGSDDADYKRIAPLLEARVGRFLNDKMPTGVAVTPAMNHGGPYPATNQPGFTAVGMPGSLKRFAKLTCFDNVSRPDRLPNCLRDSDPNGERWRQIDGQWTQGDVTRQ